MPEPSPSVLTVLTPTLRRILAVAALALARRGIVRHRRCRPDGSGPVRPDRPRVLRPLRWLVGAGLSAVGPAANYRRAAGGRPVGWQWPRSPTGRALLITHVAAGALAEELGWRAPLLLGRGRRSRVALALGLGAGFVAAHLHKDGRRGVPFHLANTASWTAATICSDGIACSALSHTAYNLAAVAMRPRPGPLDPAIPDRPDPDRPDPSAATPASPVPDPPTVSPLPERTR